MKVIKQSHKILTPINGQEIIKNVEYYGRTCYQSRDKICEGSAERFVKSIITRGHESVLEHVSITVDLITNLRVLPEITRLNKCQSIFIIYVSCTGNGISS
jgi:thymidylate synthase (FAD)